MKLRGIITGIVVEKSGTTLFARILGNAGIPITQATLLTIQYALTDYGPGGTIAPTTSGPTSLTISSVVFDSLQVNDPRWTKDSVVNPGADGQYGYNFRATLPAALFTSANKQRVDVIFTPVSGETWRTPFEWTPIPVFA